MDFAKKTRRTILICLLLSAVTLLTFWPQTRHDFIAYDDAFYLSSNAHVQRGMTWEGVAWAFCSAEASNWHPLTWLSHMLDVQLFGMKPGWHHLTSLLFHAANAVLLFLLLQRMTSAAWRSAFVAALFALHPLHVQSVAWAAERKDVLSAFFFMLTLWAYAKYAEKSVVSNRLSVTSSQSSVISGEGPGVSATDHRLLKTEYQSLFYVLSLFCFALGLMSKPMLVTLPFVLLLLDYWPLGRFQLPRLSTSDFRRWTPSLLPSITPLLCLILEKTPFLALSAVSCVLTVWAQRGGGAVVSMATLAFPQRLSNAILAYAAYLGKTFWPAHLAVLYPFEGDMPTGAVILSGAVLVAVTAWVLWCVRSRPYLAVGWFWFLGMLVPVIGLVQVGMQRMADRYTYLPLIGVFVMVAWAIPERTARWLSPRVLTAVAGLVLVAGIAVTSREVSCWQDDEHLFGRALEVTPDNYVALVNYGGALQKKGELTEAIRTFTAAVALAPELDPARCGLGTALVAQGKYAEAADQFTRVLQFQPDQVVALMQLGMVRSRQGRLAEAAEAFSHVLRLHPEDAGAHNNLGNVLAQQGKHEEAVRQFEETVRLKPDHAGAYNNLAISCKKLGRISEAISHYREAIRLQPDSIEAINNLAWLLAAHPDAQFRNGAEAVQLATRACELTRYQNPVPLMTLAAAYAETGQFQTAVSFAEQAQELARGRQGALADRLPAMLQAYRAGQPYHQP